MTLDMLERAMTYVDLDKSNFVRQSIIEKAETILAEHEKLDLLKKIGIYFLTCLMIHQNQLIA